MNTPNAAGQDMTESFLGCIRDFVLAEAQECYWQQAVLRELSAHFVRISCLLLWDMKSWGLTDPPEGTYKNGLIGKLSMKVCWLAPDPGRDQRSSDSINRSQNTTNRH